MTTEKQVKTETLQLTGIVTYASRDKESYEYGKKIIKERPYKF